MFLYPRQSRSLKGSSFRWHVQETIKPPPTCPFSALDSMIWSHFGIARPTCHSSSLIHPHYQQGMIHLADRNSLMCESSEGACRMIHAEKQNKERSEPTILKCANVRGSNRILKLINMGDSFISQHWACNAYIKYAMFFSEIFLDVIAWYAHFPSASAIVQDLFLTLQHPAPQGIWKVWTYFV